MNIPDYYIEPADYQADFDDLQAVRTAVFVDEQGIAPEQEFDELDRVCHHMLARDSQRLAIGTARITAQGQIGRLAVLRAWRGQGVGSSLLRMLIEKARGLRLSGVYAHAQLSAMAFYQKAGFVAEGEVFMEAGIPHRLMRLNLTPSSQTERATPKPRPASLPAERIETPELALQASETLIVQARRQLCIYSRDLEYGLYGQPVIVEALKQFVLRQPEAVAQIIIQEPANLRGKSHPLLELAQRLSSHFLIRAPVEEADLQYPSAFMLNDRDGYLFRQFGNRFEGHWSPNAPAACRQLQEEFELMWQRSLPCYEFRTLGI